MPHINQSHEEEATMNEVLDTINTFANNVYQKFAEIDKRFDEVDSKFIAIDERFNTIEAKLTHFVTKEYLDDKLADLRSENRLFNYQLLNTLEAKKIINQTEFQVLRKIA